jgi:hypothetical protein
MTVYTYDIFLTLDLICFSICMCLLNEQHKGRKEKTANLLKSQTDSDFARILESKK